MSDHKATTAAAAAQAAAGASHEELERNHALNFDGYWQQIERHVHRMRKQLEERGNVETLVDLNQRLEILRFNVVQSQVRAREIAATREADLYLARQQAKGEGPRTEKAKGSDATTPTQR